MEDERVVEATQKNPETKTTKQSIWTMVLFGLAALAVVVPIRLFVAEPFVVSGSSMIPAFENRNYLFIDKISYKLGDPKRNDVVVFRYPEDPTKFFLKRIIGLPNETVDIKGGIVTIKNTENPEGFTLEESFVKNTSSDSKHLELKEGEYFVMGDNRSASHDSRAWGAVKRNLITGRALLRLLPVGKIGLWPGGYEALEITKE